MLGVSLFEAWRCPTLTWGDPTLPSALKRFTSEFGMESGGSTSLWPPGKTGTTLTSLIVRNGLPAPVRLATLLSHFSKVLELMSFSWQQP